MVVMYCNARRKQSQLREKVLQGTRRGVPSCDIIQLTVPVNVPTREANETQLQAFCWSGHVDTAWPEPRIQTQKESLSLAEPSCFHKKAEGATLTRW